MTAVTLWIVHTHCYDSGDVSPNLFLRSPMKASGKTRTLEVCELLVRAARRGREHDPGRTVPHDRGQRPDDPAR